MPRDVVSEYYRLPDGMPPCRPDPHLWPTCGFFHLGPLTCFGRCSNGKPASFFHPHLRDLSPEVRLDPSTISLPFDADEVTDNLRMERYVSQGSHARERTLSALKSTYYSVRPILPVAVRKHVQRLWAAGWKRKPFPAWPVDCTVDLLMERLLIMKMKARDSAELPFIWFWPEGRSCAAMMTHDVETDSGLRFCSDMMTLDDRVGIKSSFNLVPERRYEVTPTVLSSIRNRGFEIGIHDLNHDGLLFSDPFVFDVRSREINRYALIYGARGFRSGVLYRNPDWLGALDFLYDASFPNVAPIDPQPGGCCTVMPFLIGKLVELPLTTVQDYTLLHVLHNYSLDLWKSQIELILARNGLVSFLVHPDYTIDPKAQSLYCALLTYSTERLSAENAWFALPAEIAKWWEQRSRMQLKKENGHWRIEGEGSQRATIARAVMKENTLTYELPITKSKGALDTRAS